MTEIRKLRHRKRKRSGHIVIVEIKNFKILQLRKLGRKSSIEDIVRKVKIPKTGDGGERRRDRTGEFIISE
jgi:hypothetical protein